MNDEVFAHNRPSHARTYAWMGKHPYVRAVSAGVPATLPKGQPDSIIIMPGSGNPPVFNVGGTDGVPPPDITIIFPNGRVLQPGRPNDNGDPGGGY